MELIGLKMGAIVSSVVFALIGVLIFWLCFVVIDKLTPYIRGARLLRSKTWRWGLWWRL